MSRNRLFYILVALALLLTAGLTITSAINTMDVIHRMETLPNAKAENIPTVPPGQPKTIPPSPEIFVNQGWLMGFAFIGIVAFIIGWHLSRRYARRAR